MNVPLRHRPWNDLAHDEKWARVKPLLGKGSYSYIAEWVGAPNRNSISSIVSTRRSNGSLSRPSKRQSVASRIRAALAECPDATVQEIAEELGAKPDYVREIARKNGAGFKRAQVIPPPQPVKPCREIPASDAWKPIPGVEPVTLLDLTEYSCRWPVYQGDEPRLFCGAPTELGQRYCDAHRRLSLPPLMREETAA